MVFAIAILAVALLSLVAAVLLALGRLTGASITLGVATVVAAFSPFTWITGLALLGCFVWTQWFRRRRAGVTAPGI